MIPDTWPVLSLSSLICLMPTRLASARVSAFVSGRFSGKVDTIQPDIIVFVQELTN